MIYETENMTIAQLAFANLGVGGGNFNWDKAQAYALVSIALSLERIDDYLRGHDDE